MGVIGKFESKVEGAVDGAAAAMFSSPIEPAQIAKKAEKQMKKEKLVGSGRQYAPTLYNVLVNERDDKRLLGFYPTMASEIENYLYAKGTDAGMEFDTRPLVRFIPDPGLKKGRFDVIAEVVSAPIIKKLRAEEQEYYGLAPKGSAAEAQQAAYAPDAANAAPHEAGRQQRGTGAPSPNQQGYGALAAEPGFLSNESERFSGLDVPVRNLPDSSNLPPLSLGKHAAGQGAGLGGAVAGGAVGGALGGAGAVGRQAAGSSAAAPPANRFNAGDAQQARYDEAPLSGNYDEGAVIGRAMLYNLSEQRPHHLGKRKLTLGRGKENDITLADANASRVHARMSQDATGKWKITDLGSTNGTQLGGRDINSAILKSGDEITIGTTVLQFTE